MADTNNNQQKEANFHFYLNTQGPRGQRGSKGDDGFSPSIVVSENTLNTYKLKVVTADGEFETANLRGSIIADGEGSYIKYDATTDKLYVGDIDAASPDIYGIVRTATEDDLTNLSESAVTTVSDVADFISTHLEAADDSIELTYDEDTGVIKVKANVSVEPVKDFKVVEPLVMTDGADYEKDMVIVGGAIDGDNLVFSDDWYPLFSTENDPVHFDLNGNFVLNGNEFTPSNYLSIPYQLGDIIGFAGNTGADIAAGHIREEDGQFIFTHLLRVDGLTSSSIARAVKHVASKTADAANTTLNCVGSNPHTNNRISGKEFNDGACYFQINKTADGKMEAIFLRSTTSGFTAGVKTTCATAQAVADTEALTRVFFGGTGTRLNPLNQFHIYRQPNVNLADLNSQADLAAFPDMVNFAFPDETRTIRLKYDNKTIVLDNQKRLSTSELVAMKSDITDATTAIATELNSLDARVEALEDKPVTPPYELPIASTTTLGGVKIGENITISEDGTISAVGGGGEGGTTNYEELTNLPSINNVKLIGDASLEALDVQGTITPSLPLEITQKEEGPTKGLVFDGDNNFVFTSNGYTNASSSGAGQFDIYGLNLVDEPAYDAFQLKDDNFISYIDIPIMAGYTVAIPAGIDRRGLCFGYLDEDGTFAPTGTFYNASTGDYRIIYPSKFNKSWKRVTSGSIYYARNTQGCTVTTLSNATGFDSTSMYLQINSITNQIFVAFGANKPASGAYKARNYTVPSADVADFSKTDRIRVLGAADSATNFKLEDFKLLDTRGQVITSLASEESLLALPNLFTPTKSKITRALGLNIDDSTIKVNSDGKLYAVPQEATPELPEGLTVTESTNSIDFTTSKAINLDGSMVTMPENAVVKLNGGVEKLVLNQNSVVAGDNVTIDQTATGIKINATGGGGEIDPAVLDSKQDKLYNTATVAIEDSSINLPADSYTLAGNATVNSSNQLTGTTSSSYLYINKVFNPEEKPWEIHAKFTPNSTGASSSSYVPLFAEYDTNKAVPQLYLQNGKVRCDVSTDGTTWAISELDASTTQKASSGVPCYARLKYDGSGTYTIGISSDGITWAENSQNVGASVFQSSNSKFIIGADNRSFGSAAYQNIDLNETYIKIGDEYFWHPFPISESGVLGANVKLSSETGNVLQTKEDGLYVSATPADEYGIKGDYSTHYGILDCPNGLIDFNINNKQITINAGMVLKCAGNGTTKTTIASAVNHTITSPAGAITLFYANGNMLECGKVDYSTTQPEDNGVDNYQAWFNPDKTANPDQQWQFKSNDTGNIWRPVNSATPIADIVVGNTGITSVSYIGYRVLDDDIIPQLSDIENLQETTGTLQTAVGDLQDTVAEHTTQLGGITLRRMTQAQYNALATKDGNTLYVIIDQKAFVTAAEAAHAATPTNTYTRIEVGASGTMYTATTDGYFSVRLTVGANGYVRLLGDNYLFNSCHCPTKFDAETSLFVRKGGKCSLYYNNKVDGAEASFNAIAFIACNGAE